MEEQKYGHSVGEGYEEGVFLLQDELGGRSERKQDKFSWRFRGLGEQLKISRDISPRHLASSWVFS